MKLYQKITAWDRLMAPSIVAELLRLRRAVGAMRRALAIVAGSPANPVIREIAQRGLEEAHDELLPR